MSDFVSGFWNVYVTIITLVSVIGCGVFLWIQSKAKVAASAADAETNHVWDENLQEYNNALPRWWSWLFYITVIFSLAYLVLYPGLGSYPGVLNWTSHGKYDAEVADAAQQAAPIYAKFKGQDLKALAADPEAHKMGERMFLAYCSQCHGSDARGAKGFPNLTDSDWQWGGTPEEILTSIMDGRMAVMSPHPDLPEETVKDLANYVRSLSGAPHDAARAARGKETFAASDCVACHGPDAKGSAAHGMALGAPNLTDSVWLYGSSEATIMETIVKGRTNKMPAHKDFLGEDKARLLAAYVYGLSQGGAKGQ